MNTTIRPRALSEEAACTYIGVSPSTLQRLVRAGKVKKPKVVSTRRVVYEVADLDAYLDDCPRSDLPPGPGRKKETA